MFPEKKKGGTSNHRNFKIQKENERALKFQIFRTVNEFLGEKKKETDLKEKPDRGRPEIERPDLTETERLSLSSFFFFGER